MNAIHGGLSGPDGVVRVRRVRAGLTQEQLAEISGLSVRAISDIERGTTARPRRSSVVLLEAALGLAGSGDDNLPGDGWLRPGGAGASLPAIVPRQLPQQARGFVGRTRELRALTELLDRPETASGAIVISAIVGTAGVGKSALAVHWAHQVAEGFPDGQLFVNLRGYDPDRPMLPEDALAGFLRALGLVGQDIPPEADERAALYRSLLAGRRMLVVLDNAGSVEQVRPLLPGTPACAVVVTSRDALAGLVARDGAARLDLDPLPLQDAVGLLQTLIGRRVDVSPGTAQALAERCSRLPLALRVAAELAAARPSVPLADLADELADQQRRLDLLDAGGDPRTGVRAVFSWSYRHLNAGTARAFRLLGLHPGPNFDLYAAAALTGATLDQAQHALDLLARSHLIQPAGPSRHDLHDLLRGYARELAVTDAEDEREAALTRLFDYYQYAAAAAMDTLYASERHRRPHTAVPASPVPLLAEPVAARAWLDAERASLVAAVAEGVGHGFPGHAIRLATTVFRYLEFAGHYQEVVTISEHARRAAQDTGDCVAEARALNDLTVIDLRQSRYQQAEAHLRQVLALCLQTGDQTGQARALGNLGIASFQQGRYRDADGHHEQALGLYRQIGDRFGEARTLNNLGMLDLRLGRYDRATDRLRQAVALSRQTGDRTITACGLINLGVVDLRQGRHARADSRLREAQALNRETGNPAIEAFGLVNLGLVDLRQGRHAQAAIRFRQALRLSRESGDRCGEAEALNGLGEACLAVGQARRARAKHRAALGLASMIGDKYEQARARSGLADSYHAVGEVGRARHYWRQAFILFSALGTPEADQVRERLAMMGEC